MNATTDDPKCQRCGDPRSVHSSSELFCRSVGQIVHKAVGGSGPARFRRRVEDMPRLGVAPHPSVPIGEYHHYKGGSYLVIGGCLDDDTQEVMVLFVSAEHGYVGPARTVADFLGVVDWPDGTRGPRFRRVGS